MINISLRQIKNDSCFVSNLGSYYCSKCTSDVLAKASGNWLLAQYHKSIAGDKRCSICKETINTRIN